VFKRVFQTAKRLAQLLIRLRKRICPVEIFGESSTYLCARAAEVVDCRPPNGEIIQNILLMYRELLIWPTAADIEYELTLLHLKVQPVWFTPAIINSIPI